MTTAWRAEPGSRLAKLRTACHGALDVLWEFQIMTRSDAYAALAREMGLPLAECHFGMFDEDQCESALAAIRRLPRSVSK